MALYNFMVIKNTFLTAQAHFSLVYRVLIHDVGKELPSDLLGLPAAAL